MATWVLMRGLGREAAHWGNFPPQLARADSGARVVTVDLPGAGVLRHQRAALRMQDAVAACRAQLCATAVQPPYRLFGLSLGGMVASAWAHSWPQEVSHCVLVNTSARSVGPLSWRLRRSAWLDLLRVMLAAGDPDRAEERILALTSNRPALRAGMLPHWAAIRRERPMTWTNIARQLLCASHYQLPSQPPHARTLILTSRGDRLVDSRCSFRLGLALNCDCVAHRDAGHDLPLDDPQWVLDQVLAWDRQW